MRFRCVFISLFLLLINFLSYSDDYSKMYNYILKRDQNNIKRLLNKKGFDINNTEYGSILENALLSRNIELAKLVLENGINPNVYKNSPPILITITNEDLESLKLLIDYKVELNTIINDQNILFYARSRTSKDILKLLIDNGADVNYIDKSGQSLLLFFLFGSDYDLEMIKYLISKNINLNHFTGDKTYLFLTIMYCEKDKKYYELLELLLENKADPNLGHNDNYCLSLAIDRKDMDIVKMLLKYGANPNINIEEKSYLYKAIEKGNLELAEVLLENKADPNYLTKKNYSALMLAVEKGYIGLVEKLLYFGADKNLKDIKGLTAYDIALSKKYTEIANLLK